MSGSKLIIDRAAGAGAVFIETDDIDDVSPIKDKQHAAVVTVRWRQAYQETEAFEWVKGGHLMRLRLLPRQVRSAVAQLREEQEGYCVGSGAGCFDYAKVTTPPPHCIRCLLLDACRLSGQGDLRKASPVVKEGPGYGLPLAFGLLFVIWWLTLMAWSGAAAEATKFHEELQGCRAKQSPTARD